MKSLFTLATAFILFLMPFEAKANTKSLHHLPAKKYFHITASDDPNFVWFRVAKVGTRSIYKALADNEVSFTVNDSFVPYRAKDWKKAFKFAFVRNPWARVVSCYIDKVTSKNHRAFAECFDKDFDYFVNFINKKDLKNIDRHIQLQTELIPLDSVDFVGRMENFEEDLNYVLTRLGLPNTTVPHKHKTNHKHYSQFYNERTKAIIAKKYKKDIETFGYQFEYSP